MMMIQISMKPELKDWTEWKILCARKLCSEDVQTRLGSFAQSRFGIQLQRQVFTTNLQDNDALRQLPSADDAWHQFESFAALKQTREGKRYKDWIFARVEGGKGLPLDIIQSGATLIMRSVVRAHLKAEYTPRMTVSMDQPLGNSELTMGDLLPGKVAPVDEVAANEYNLLAKEHVENLFKELSYRERIGLLAKFNGVALDNEKVLKAAGCGKSILNQVVRDMLAKLREDIKREYCDDGYDAITAFTILVVQELEKKLNHWKSLESNLPDCFYIEVIRKG